MRVILLILTTVLYLVRAEGSFIDPKNFFTNDKYCLDVECAKNALQKNYENTENLNEMKVCAKTADDNELSQLLFNLLQITEDTKNLRDTIKNQVTCRQNAYRLIYMYGNTMWNSGNLLREHLKMKLDQTTQTCFKGPLDEFFKRIGIANKCWQKENKYCCMGNKENDQVCGKQRNIENTNTTCMTEIWQQTTFNRTVPIMKNCVANANMIESKIREYKDALSSLKNCYNYSNENKNYVELNRRLQKVYDIEQNIKNDVNQQPQQVQDCFILAFDIVEERYAKTNKCKI